MSQSIPRGQGGSLRSNILGLVKRGIHRLGASPRGEKVLRLVAEEYAVLEAAKATRAAEPALRHALAPVVLRGPFASLQYPEHGAIGSSYWPKLLGAYECELAPTIEALISKSYSHVLDIGAAEGYYAVGLARRLPAARVIAFEGNPKGQRMLRAMAVKNGTGHRIQIEGWCDLPALRGLAPTLPAGQTLVMCDAEASEYDLLDPTAVPELAGWDMLVELHRRSSIGDPRAWVTRTFQSTHAVSFVDSEPRLPSAYPELRVLSTEHRAGVLLERTDPFGWALLESLQA
jgi:hypothetical protein